MDDQYQHPAFPQPDDLNVNLWRYLDVEKFDWLVSCGRLFMPTADRLGDPLEGTRPDGDLEWWRRKAENATSEDQRRIIEQNLELLSRFAIAFRSNYYVSCWHMNQSENAKMWRCYTKSPSAVAIRTTYRELRASLPSYVEIGLVRYIDYATTRLPTFNMFDYIMHKDICYSFEREVRAVALQPATAELGLSHFEQHFFQKEESPKFHVFAPPVDVATLLHEAILHPDATPTFGETVRELCSEASLPNPKPSSFTKMI